MQNFFSEPFVINLFVAMILGMVLGLERFIAHKTAGMRTYTLVSLGSAVFVLISQLVAEQVGGYAFDPLRIAAQVVAGVGFLGVGAIFRTNERVSGLTTASGLWVAAGIGMAAGFGLHALAITVTILALFTFIVLWFIEKKLRNLELRQNKKRDESQF